MPNTNKYQHWIRSGFFNGLQKMSVPIFGVLSTMLLAKHALTKPEMGVWSLFLTITSFVELIRQALVKTSLIKFINSCEEKDQRKVLSAAFFLNLLITVLLCILFLFGAPVIANLLKVPQLINMLYIFIAGMVLLIPFSHLEWMMYGKSLFNSLFYTFFFRQGLTLLMIAIHFYTVTSISLEQLVVYYNLGILFGLIVALYFLKSSLVFKLYLTKDWIKQLWFFGKYVLGSGISTLLFRNADQFLVSNLLANPAFVASQSISLRIINLADIPSQVLGDILFPKSSNTNSKDNPEKIKYYYEKTVGASLCFILPVIIFIFLFSKFIILFLASSEYLDAIPYLRLISISTIFLAFLKQYGIIIDSTGKPQINFLTITIIAIIHIALLWVMIHQYKFLGAAYALLLSHVIGFIITQSILKKQFNISWINCFKNAFNFYPELFILFSKKILSKWKTAS
jgi:lipopolysaccharide exporter